MKMKLRGLIIGIVSIMLMFCTVKVQAAAVHNVTFQYGSKTYVTQVADGGTAIPPTDTYVPGYVFSGWVGNATNVKSDVVIIGAYIKTDAVTTNYSEPANTQYNYKVNSNVSAPAINAGGLKQGVAGQYCAVHWYNGVTGQIIRDDLIPYGTSVANIPDPSFSGYDFTGWEGSWENVTSDRYIKAWYFKVNKVEFVDTLTGAVFNTQYVRNGEDAKLPEVPYHSGYHFESMDGEYANVNSDRKIYVNYGFDYWDYHDTPEELWWMYVDMDGDGSYEDDVYWWL